MIDHYSLDIRKAVRMLLVFAGVILGIFIVYKLAYYLAPFIIAFAIASLVEPLIKLLNRKAGISRRVSAPIVLLIVVMIIGTILVMIISKLVSEIISFSHIAPKFFSDLYLDISSLIVKAQDWSIMLPPELNIDIQSIITNLSSNITNLVNFIVKGAFTTATSLPEVLIFILVTIISTYFLTSDREKIAGFFRRQFPESWVEKFRSVRNDMFSALFGYVRAQLIMMSITFTELFIGFNLIHVKYTLLLALLVSLIDALPILGTGSVLIPWTIYSILTGNLRLGISLLILYVVVLIVRQMLEPKVLGHQIGVYPLLTLMAMYGGLKLIGVAGLILGPITFLLLKNIFTGILKDRSIKDLLNKS